MLTYITMQATIEIIEFVREDIRDRMRARRIAKLNKAYDDVIELINSL